MNLARSSVKLSAARYGSAILQFLAIVYFESVIGLSQLGTFFLFQALLGILGIPADFGLKGAVEKRVSEGSDAGKYVVAAILLKLVPLAVICLGTLHFSDSLASYTGTDIAIYLAFGLVLQEVSQLGIAVLKGNMRVEETAILEVLRKVTWVVLSVFLVQYSLKAEALIIGHLFGVALVGIIGWIKLSMVPNSPSEEHIISLLNYGKFNFLSSIGGQAYNWVDIVMIGYFLTESHVAAYEIAWRITSFTIIYSKALSTALFPQISSWHYSGAADKIEDKLTELLALTPLIVVPAFFGVTIYSEEILTIVFSEEAAIASLALIILMVDEITESVQTVVGKALQAVNRPDLAAQATIISVVLNIILNVVLIWQFGIVGAALASTTASFVGGVLLHTLYLDRIISLHFPYRAWAECCLAALLMSVGLLAIDHLLIIDTVPRLAFIVTVGIILYFGLLSQSPSIRTVAEKQLQEYRGGP